MIIVIADDITGAAEIAGVCLRYRLQVLFGIDNIPEGNADVVIVACDSRSESENKAAEIHARIAKEIKEKPFDWIFKKCDSVLRGYVTTEITALMDICQVENALIVPVNPATGRIIRRGEYFIADIPLHKTAFAADPDFPAESSLVNELIAARNTRAVPYEIPDCEHHDELIKLAEVHQYEKLFTGSSAWFHEILLKKHQFQRKSAAVSSPVIKNFIVFNGSLHPSGKDFLHSLDNQYPVISLPIELYQSEYLELNTQKLQEQLIETFLKSQGLFIFLPPDILQYCNDTSILLHRTMLIIEKLWQLPQTEQWMITGGATSYATLQHLQIHTLIPEEELAAGVINFRIQGENIRRIAVKPGSYPWDLKFI